jgi:hypothetical protein
MSFHPNRKVQEYLRGHKLRRAAKSAGMGPVPHILLTKSIIGNLDVPIKGQKNVVEFKITIYHTVLMEIFQSQAHLSSVKPISCE